MDYYTAILGSRMCWI